MTVTYRTSGRLTHPVSDLTAARAFLREPDDDGDGMAGFIYPDEARPGVHSVQWDLLDESTWQVTLVADHPLGQDQLTALSSWISGQNSDGLGEGFEQQPFAEHEEYDDYGSPIDDTYEMSSFDWGSNPCTLEVVR